MKRLLIRCLSEALYGVLEFFITLSIGCMIIYGIAHWPWATLIALAFMSFIAIIMFKIADIRERDRIRHQDPKYRQE